VTFCFRWVDTLPAGILFTPLSAFKFLFYVPALYRPAVVVVQPDGQFLNRSKKP
jgi:hypothetical protein